MFNAPVTSTCSHQMISNEYELNFHTKPYISENTEIKLEVTFELQGMCQPHNSGKKKKVALGQKPKFYWSFEYIQI